MNVDRVVERKGTNSLKWDLGNIEGILPMWVADMDFPVAQPIIETIKDRLEHPMFGYPLLPESYVQSILDWQRNQLGFSIEKEAIVFAPSIMAAVRLLVNLLAKEGESVVIQPPVYHPFFHAVEDQNRNLVTNPLINLGVDKGYEMDLDGLERSFIQNYPKLLLLCSPHNPVSKVWSAETLVQVLELCAKYKVICVADEIHIDLPLDGYSTTSILKALEEKGSKEDIERFFPYLVVLQSTSKTFNLPGLSSCQAIIRDENLRKRFSKALNVSGIDLPNVLSLVAAEAGYRKALSWLQSVRKQISENRQYLKSVLDDKDWGISLSHGEATYLAWLDVSRLLKQFGKDKDDSWLVNILKKEAKLWLSPGSQFGKEGAGFLRMNMACPKVLMEDGVRRLTEWIEKSKS